MTSLHQALRNATRSHHDCTEQLPLFARVLSGRVGPSSYRSYLQVLHAWLLGLPDLHLDWPEDLKSQWRLSLPIRLDWLTEDLQSLGVESVSQPRIKPSWAEPATSDAVWGMLYVVEGSALGGRVLARQLADSHLPTRYLDGHRDQTGAYWSSFLSRLEQGVQWSDPRVLEVCLLGAQRAFAALASDDRVHQGECHERA